MLNLLCLYDDQLRRALVRSWSSCSHRARSSSSRTLEVFTRSPGQGAAIYPATLGPWQDLAIAPAVPTPAPWTHLSGVTQVHTVTARAPCVPWAGLMVLYEPRHQMILYYVTNQPSTPCNLLLAPIRLPQRNRPQNARYGTSAYRAGNFLSLQSTIPTG